MVGSIVIFYIVLFLIITRVRKRNNGLNQNAWEKARKLPSHPPGSTQMPTGTISNTGTYKKEHGIGGYELKKRYKESADHSGAKFRKLEDRQNDWLARQIREEAKWKRNSCFDPAAELKKAHADSCDARALKREHAAAHRKGRY